MTVATVERRKLAWVGYVTRHDSLSKTILRGTLEGGRRRGWQTKCWMDNIKEWKSLLMPDLTTRASCKKTGRGSLLIRSSCPPYDPVGQGTGLNMSADISISQYGHPEQLATINTVNYISSFTILMRALAIFISVPIVSCQHEHVTPETFCSLYKNNSETSPNVTKMYRISSGMGADIHNCGFTRLKTLQPLQWLKGHHPELWILKLLTFSFYLSLSFWFVCEYCSFSKDSL